MSLTIRTNLSSLIAQNSLKTSTNKLNQAIERMTSGAKINHAKDNAANYSIATNMTTKINAYMVAEDNCAMGLDMISTATDSLDLISNNLSRLRALATQAQNGTYGKQSIKAMNAEAVALINEMYRAKNSTEYNGIKPLGNSVVDEGTCGASGLEINSQGFLLDVARRDTSSMTKLAEIDETQTLAVGTYSISSADELAKLARMQNSGKVVAGSEFVLGADIDLSAYSSGSGWTPIGHNTHFSGTFDGNGHKITNLYTNSSIDGYRGLFSYIEDAEIKNLGIDSGEIRCADINSGPIASVIKNSSVINCYAKIDVINAGVSASDWLGVNGGLIGRTAGFDNLIDHCYATGDVISTGNKCGGLIGLADAGIISNCFTTGNVTCDSYTVGGLIGQNQCQVENCFATGDVIANKGANAYGGLIGKNCEGGEISNCHASGNVLSIGNSSSIETGGLIGVLNEGNISNCYSTGDVYSDGRCAGGFIGQTDSSTASIEITNCFATGNVEAKGNYIGGFIGRANSKVIILENCYAKGDVSGNSYIGGFLGYTYNKTSLINSYAEGNVNGDDYLGGLCGYVSSSSTISNSYATGNINGDQTIGGLCGTVYSAEITNSYATGKVEGTSKTGGLFGYTSSSAKVSDCYVLGKSENVEGAIAGYAGGTFTNCHYIDYYKDKALKGSGSADLSDCDVYQGSTPFKYNDSSATMQVGINGNDSSQITIDCGFELGNLKNILYIGIENSKTLGMIDNAISLVSNKQTEIGAVQNRLESALDSISVAYDNLVSSRSTIQDADIAELSSEYIRQQILQQASATLMATANQNPAIALQLI